jgi:signal transduction histidine kinase
LRIEHGGKIVVSSVQDVGTAITVTLPAPALAAQLHSFTAAQLKRS